MRLATRSTGGSVNRPYLAIITGLTVPLWSVSAFAQIQPNNCARAANYSESKRGIAMLVMQSDKVVFEHYAPGMVRDGRWPIFSGTKSFWGLAALCAVRDGLVKLDEPVATTITEWKSDPRKSRITVRQLLSLTSGIEPAPHLHRTSIPNRDAAALRLNAVADPGARFIYGPSHLQVFDELLRRKLNGRSTISYIRQNVLEPMGLANLEFKRDGSGNPLLASGFELSTREWARLGELLLGHGNFRGHQVVPADLLRSAFTGSGANISYGLTFWLNRPGGREIDVEKELDLPWERAHWNGIAICNAAPSDMIVGLGSGYQRLFVIPSLNAVIVRQGRDAKFSDGKFLRLVLGR